MSNCAIEDLADRLKVVNLFHARAETLGNALHIQIGLLKSIPTTCVVSIVVPATLHHKSFSNRYSEFTKRTNMDRIACLAAVHSS